MKFRFIFRFILAICAALVIFPAGASAAETGINIQNLSAEETVSQANTLNATWIRRFVSWQEMQVSESAALNPFIIDYLDQLTARAALSGRKVQFNFIGAPSWANGSSDALVPPQDPGKFADFIFKIASRYKGLVQSYEIWNEPDAPEFWHGTVSPEEYKAMLVPAYQAIKRADPAAQVLAGPLTGNNYNFVDGLYKAGAKGSFDGVAVHTDTACGLKSPYDYYRDPNGRVGQYTFLGFREVHQIMADNGDGDKPIVMSELGWSTTSLMCARGAGAGTKAAGVSDAKQDLFLKQAYNCLDQYPYMTAGIWFNLKDSGQADSELDRYGLISYNSLPKPSYQTMAEVGKSGGNVLNEPCGDFTGPDLTVYQPQDGEIYNNLLSFSVSARDSQSPLSRIRIYADDVRLRSVTGMKNGEKTDFYWFGARSRSLGKVKITVEAKDSFGNATRKDINVVKTDPKQLGPQSTQMKLAVSNKDRRHNVKGRVYVSGNQLTPTGAITLSWQKRRGSSWRTVYKEKKFTTKPYSISRKLKRGTWRVRSSYTSDYPFSSVSKTSRSFTVR